jgi:hypothetical protein
VIQILLFPCAKFLEFVLPDWGITLVGVRHSLNPGPWTFKGELLASISAPSYTLNTEYHNANRTNVRNINI